MADVMNRLQSALADRYTIERELGRGGMATVYLARDQKHERHVALKVFHPELAQVLGPERFLREVKVTAQLHHPHILPLYDSGSADGLLYYVMPYVEGESLRDRLEREKQLPLEDALRISREVAEALAYAHSHDVIHRDIKPENILLESGHAVVADFGIARAITVAGGQRLTATGIALGTPAYMSPEQGAGEQALDGRSDLYSLGCVVYEMLAGEPPITGPSAVAVLARKSVDVPPELRRLRSAVPAEVERAVTRALSVVPADRPRTALEFAEQLTSATAIPAAPVAAPTPIPTTSNRRRAPWLVALAALAVLVIAVVVWRVMPRGGSNAAAVANRVVVLPYDNRTGDSTLAPIGGMVADWVTEGLARTSEVQVVPNMIVLQALGGIRSRSGGSESEVPIQELARATQSGIAVAGSYYRHGDSLEFHSELLDVAAGSPLGAVQPVLGLADDPSAAVDTVRLRVMAVLAARLGGVRWEIPRTVQPPSYDAYRAYADGISRWIAGSYLEAAALFDRAYALDTTYLRARILAAGAYNNAGDRARSDSALAFLLRRRNQLSPYDQYRLDWFMAGRRGDREAQVQAARAGAKLAPFGTIRFALIGTLEVVNRPREALAEMDGYLEQGAAVYQDAASWYAIWGTRTELYHVLGQHERELDVARDGRERLGGSLRSLLYEGRALAALGRVEELRPLTEEVLGKSPGQGLTAGDVLLSLAEELRAHGHGAEASEVGDRALAWYRAQPPADIARGWRRDFLASLLYAQKQWAAAAAQWDSIPADSIPAVSRLGTRGVLAARLGLTDSARAIAGALAHVVPTRLNGQHTLWRARIVALLGDKESAVALLRQAFAEGVAYGIWLHVDMDLESLRDYKPFQELIRPKG